MVKTFKRHTWTISAQMYVITVEISNKLTVLVDYKCFTLFFLIFRYKMDVLFAICLNFERYREDNLSLRDSKYRRENCTNGSFMDTCTVSGHLLLVNFLIRPLSRQFRTGQVPIQCWLIIVWFFFWFCTIIYRHFVCQ